VFDEMPRYGVPRNVYSYTALINAYGKNAQYPRSLELLADMKRAHVMPNVVTYNTIINACAKVGYSKPYPKCRKFWRT
jgi:pentatricopeptide repeat protein